MIGKIEELDKNDEYGYTFTTLERESFKRKLKELFNKEIDI